MVIKLETKRLILRKPKMSDWKDLLEGMSNLNISKNLEPVSFPYKKKDAQDFIKKRIKKWNKKEQDDFVFFIELKSEKKVIGTMGLHNVDKFNGLSETGSWINEKYWRKSYITEAKIAVNEFAFNKLKLRKLHSPLFATNKASDATQKRMGYKLEGVLRKHSKCKATNKIHDVKVYGLLKEDWKKNLPKLKKHLKKKIRILEEGI
jgi:[ribosomal protein S5]-alanine N-acetyltransferase